jgi:hypothetical protein
MFYFGCGVLYPEFLTGLLKLMVWYCLFLPGGIFCSTVGKDSSYPHRSEFFGKMVFPKAWRGVGSFVVINFGCSQGRETSASNQFYLYLLSNQYRKYLDLLTGRASLLLYDLFWIFLGGMLKLVEI